LLPLSECKFTLETIIEELQRDPQPNSKTTRPLRATGVAVAVAVSLLEHSFAGSVGRVMLFSAGPCTVGPGMVISEDMKELIRSHHDINKDRAPHMAKATKVPYPFDHSVVA
jgi:protein transport protein SEC23